MPALPWDLALFCPLKAPSAQDKVHEKGTDIRSVDATLVIDSAGAERTAACAGHSATLVWDEDTGRRCRDR